MATIVPLDVHDEQALRAWWEVGRASSAERPVAGWPVWDVARHALPMSRTDGRAEFVRAVEDGTTVGAAELFCFLRENTHLGEVFVHVHPDARRRGIGSALLAELERRAVLDGRTVLVGTAHAPVGSESAGTRFAAAHGYEVASLEETKVVRLADAEVSWERLDGLVAAAMGSYRVEVHEERVPDRHVEGYCRLLSAFLGEVPTGELELEEASWTVDRLREHEERARAAGWLLLMAVAVSPDGELCGFSDLRVARADPSHAAVGGTLVLPGHRGHRLGLAMKLATHRLLLRRHPGCRYVETGNAGVNAAMNAVNSQLGYEVVERSLDVQKRL